MKPVSSPKGMERAIKNGSSEKSAVLCINRHAAMSWPRLCAQAPATLTPGSEKTLLRLAAYITARLKTAPVVPMQKAGVNSPVNSSAVSITRTARYSAVCRRENRYRHSSVTLLASPGFSHGAIVTGSRPSAKRRATAAAAKSASMVKVFVLV